MDFVAGSILTFFLFFFTVRMIQSNKTINDPIPTIRYSQSHLHSIVSPLLPLIPKQQKQKNSQSMELDKKRNIKVIIVDNLAYWIKDNKFYVADMDGADVDGSTSRIVDTMGMDKIQLDKMLFIMDQLREGKDVSDDSGDSGY
jgi:hypothetical protein